MIFSRHPLKNSAILTTTDENIGNYPIGLSIEKFLDFWNDVKSIEYSIFSSPIGPGLFSISNLQDALQAISDLEDQAEETYSIQGFTQRQTKIVGRLSASGGDLTASQEPTAAINYPYFGAFEIDFGKSKYREGLFYPYFNFLLGDGSGNASGGVIIGGVTFEDYGIIPIYSGPSYDPIRLNFANGFVAVKERFSSITLDAKEYRAGSVLSARTNGVDISSYSKIVFRGGESQLESAGGGFTCQIPATAKSGPIYIEKQSPYDFAPLYEEIVIS